MSDAVDSVLTSTLLADVGAWVLRSNIRSLNAGWRVHARALTVSVAPGDNLAIHAALAIARPGDMLVVAGHGHTERALMGGIMCAQAAASGLAGVVIDGAARDVAELREAGFPVFAVGTSPAGPFKGGPGAVGKPVVCGGVVVHTGDWVLADDDGIVVYRPADKDALHTKGHAKHAAEQSRLAAIARGELRPAWLDEALARGSIDVAQEVLTRTS